MVDYLELRTMKQCYICGEVLQTVLPCKGFQKTRIPMKWSATSFWSRSWFVPESSFHSLGPGKSLTVYKYPPQTETFLQGVEKSTDFCPALSCLNDVFPEKRFHVYVFSECEFHLANFRQEFRTNSCTKNNWKYRQSFNLSSWAPETRLSISMYLFLEVEKHSRAFVSSVHLASNYFFQNQYLLKQW